VLCFLFVSCSALVVFVLLAVVVFVFVLPDLVVFVFSGSGCLFLFFLVFCLSLAPDLVVFAGFVRVLVVFVRIRFSHHHLPCWVFVFDFWVFVVVLKGKSLCFGI
jgi:hypothetical protein